MALAFWSLSSAGNGSDVLWAVEYKSSSEKQISIDGRLLPVFEIFFKPRSNNGSIVSIKEIESIPGGLAPNVSYGMYVSITSGNIASGGRYYLIYDPVTDTIYTPGGRPTHSVGLAVINRFMDSWAYKSFEFLRNPPSSVLSSEGMGGRILVKLQAYILAGVSLGLSLYVLLLGYRAIDNFLYGVHKTYMQKKSARYIKSVMDENGGDPLGGNEKSSRSGVDPSIEFPPPR